MAALTMPARAYADPIVCPTIPSFTEAREVLDTGVHADSGPMPSDERERVRLAASELKRGEAMIEDKLYEQAAATLEYALLLDPEEPDILYSLATANHHLGEKYKALDYYRRYMEVGRNARNRAVVARYIEHLETLIAAETEIVGYYDGHIKTLHWTCQRAARALARAERREREPFYSDKRVLGVSLMSMGVLTLGGAVLHSVDAYRLNDSRTVEAVLWGTSVAMLVSGGVLYYLDRRESAKRRRASRSRRVSIAPALLPGGAGLSLVAPY